MSDPYASRLIVLPPNQPARPYRGGAGIARLRGLPEGVENRPEDFVGSTTSVLGSDTIGLTVLDDGTTLRAHVEADPAGFLGPEHVDRYADDTGLLVKLLDPGERLFVHFHPDAGFAATHLNCRHGKSEGWVITEVTKSADPDSGHVYLGFREEVDPVTIETWVAGQHIPEILISMNRVPVYAGDSFFVPAGTPHAIGPGVTAVELQEPTDFSIVMEWKGFDVPPEARHLGLDLPTAMRALDRTGWDRTRVAAARAVRSTAQPAVISIFPEAADAFFRAERVIGDAAFAAGFSIVVTIGGSGRLIAAGGEVGLAQGTCVLVPYGAGAYRIAGDVEAIRCLPPLP